MRISDWSSDVCSSDLFQHYIAELIEDFTPLSGDRLFALANDYAAFFGAVHDRALQWPKTPRSRLVASHGLAKLAKSTPAAAENALPRFAQALGFTEEDRGRVLYQVALWTAASYEPERSAEHTSELQSLMRISYACFC